MALAQIRGLAHYESSASDSDSEDGGFQYEDSQEEDSQDEDSQDEDSQDEDSQDDNFEDDEFEDSDSQNDNLEYENFESDDFDDDDDDDDFKDDDSPTCPAASQAVQDRTTDNPKGPTVPRMKTSAQLRLKRKQKPIQKFADIEHLFTFPPFTFSNPLWRPPFHIGSRAQNRAEILRYARALGAVDPESDIPHDEGAAGSEDGAVILSAPTNTVVVQRIVDVLEACKRVLATVEDDLLRTLPRERFIARDIAPQSVIACVCWNNRLQPSEEWGGSIPRHHRCFAKDRVRNTPWTRIKESVVGELIRLHQHKQGQRRAQNDEDNGDDGDNGGDWVLKLQHNKPMLRMIVDFIGINYVNNSNLRDNLREDLDASTDAERYCCQLALGVLVKYRDFFRYPAFLADLEEWKRKKAAGNQIEWPMRDASGEPLVYHANVRVAWDSDMAWDSLPAVHSDGEEEEESQPCPIQIKKTASDDDDDQRCRRSASQSPASTCTVITRRPRKKQVVQGRDDSAVVATIADEYEEIIGDENDYDHENDEPAATFEPPSDELPLHLRSAPSTQRERSRAAKKDNRDNQTNSKSKKKKRSETSRHSTSASQQKRDSRGRFIKAGTSSSNANATAEPSSSPAAPRIQTNRSASRAGQSSRSRARGRGRGRGRASAPVPTTVGGNDQASSTDQPSPAVATKGPKTLPQRDASGRWIKGNPSSSS